MQPNKISSDFPEISIVIPAHNEQDNIRNCLFELNLIMSDQVKKPYEIIVIDDGSIDGTYFELQRIKNEIPELVVLRFANNYGQTAAFDAGFKAARGKVIVTMDADLQNDPKDIPELLKNLESWDVVCGIRQRRKDSFVRIISSRIANYTRNKLTYEQINDVGCSLRAFKTECIKGLKLYNGMHRFLPTLFKLDSWTVKEIPVSHRPRQAGQTHYGINNRLFRGLRDIFAVRWMRSRWINYQIEEKIQ
jgi:glycosyltransferase involved in cell wall biosynthesis